MKKQVLVLGSGQLARMMALAGGSLNIQLLAFDVNTDRVVHPLSGMISDKGLNAAIDWCDVITAEFEHIPYDILELCANSGKLLPSAKAIQTGGDRRLEKQMLDEADIRSASYCIINGREDFNQAISQLGLPIVFKSALGGYDGKGQWRLTDDENTESVWLEMEQCLSSADNQGIVAEQHIPFSREVSVIGVRDHNGNVQVYPITENRHIGGILSSSVVLDNPSLQEAAEQIFTQLADALNYIGVLTIELFEVDGQLMVNEIAPRVHNSGHWTMQGAETCQFENHLRAICGFPIGSTRMVRPTVMINVLGVDQLDSQIYSKDGYHVHWYGKDKRPGRKMGHINICLDKMSALHNAVSDCCSIFTVSDQ